MKLLGIQIIGLLFALVMIYITFLNKKRKEFTIRESGFWIILWILFIIVTIFPQLLDPVLETLSLSRTMDFFIIIGFLFLIATNFYTYTLVRANQRKMEKIVRRIAIEKK